MATAGLGAPQFVPTLQWLEIVQLIISLLMILIFLYGALRGIVVYRRQMNAQLFLAFTKRFDEVMTGFVEGTGGTLDVVSSPPPPTDHLRASVVRYLNLCSEEFYLHRRGYLDHDIWTIWEADLKGNLTSPLITREWPGLRDNYVSFREFQSFLDGLQSEDALDAAALDMHGIQTGGSES